MSTITTVNVNYLIFGMGPGNAMSLSIPLDALVCTFKEMVREKDPSLLSVAASAMRLSKLKVPLAPDEASRVTDPLQNDALQDLPPLTKMSAVFEDLEDLEDLPTDKVHVILLVPTGEPTTHYKRPRSPSPSLQTQLKRSKLGSILPSNVGRPSNYWNIQAKPSERLLDDRPVEDTFIAPITLLYSGFGRFEDIVTRRKGFTTIARHNSINTHNFYDRVKAFVEAMSEKYDNEDKRRDTGLKLLNGILKTGYGEGSYTLTSAIGPVRFDGHTVGSREVPLTVVEFKNNLANITADPCVEAVAHITNLHIAMLEDSKLKGLSQGWRFPCLVVTIVGHMITFYATVLLKSQYRVVSLTPTLSCLPSASSGQDLDTLCLALAAMIDLRKFIIADIERYSVTPPSPIPPGDHCLPAIFQLRKHGVPGEHVQFQIAKYLFETWQRNRQLYLALMPEDTGDSSIILVKFSRTYSVDLHDYCFRAGHALKLLAYEVLPGGWCGIAMEYLGDTDYLNATSATRFKAKLTKLVDGFHQQGWVHGDLRDANIRWRGDQFWVIDFDWGGKDGQVEYPTPYLNPELLKGRTGDDLRIRKEDDLRMLCNTLHQCLAA